MDHIFNLSKSVKVLKVNKNISKSKLQSFFNQACSDKKGNFIKQKDNQDMNGVRYSYRFFKKIGEPSFLKDSNYLEEKYGFCFVVQYEGYVLINSRYCLLNKKNLELLGAVIPFDEFSQLVADESTEFLKMNLKNTSVLSTAIKNRSVEGEDLSKTFSPVYASKNIVRSCKMKNGLGVFSQSPNASRLTNYESKSNVYGYLEWCKELIEFISSNKKGSEYLSNFSRSIEYQKENEKEESLIPESIMFDISFIHDFNPTFSKEIDGKMNEVDLNQVIDMYNKTFELVKGKENPELYTAKINDVVSIKVLKLRKKIRITVDTNLILTFENEGEYQEVDFNELLAESSIITFEDIKYSYYAETLFLDNYLVNNKSSFLDNFIVVKGLEKTKSEKGEFTKASTSFAEDSVFGVLESYLENEYDYIFCDDLGSEYADFIAFKGNKIGFYHAKSSKSKFSASDFHEVVAQALKNLSHISDIRNIVLDEETNPRNLKTKKELWEKNYKLNNVSTKISRLRKPENPVDIKQEVENGINLIKKTNSSGQTTRIVALVVDFISKDMLEKEIMNNTNKELKQILWILSSFISTCQEVNIIPQILCKK